MRAKVLQQPIVTLLLGRRHSTTAMRTEQLLQQPESGQLVPRIVVEAELASKIQALLKMSLDRLRRLMLLVPSHLLPTYAREPPNFLKSEVGSTLIRGSPIIITPGGP
jgi:hypothetical protein